MGISSNALSFLVTAIWIYSIELNDSSMLMFSGYSLNFIKKTRQNKDALTSLPILQEEKKSIYSKTINI